MLRTPLRYLAAVRGWRLLGRETPPEVRAQLPPLAGEIRGLELMRRRWRVVKDLDGKPLGVAFRIGDWR